MNEVKTATTGTPTKRYKLHLFKEPVLPDVLTSQARISKSLDARNFL
jgi:hypothetical protein